MPDPDDQPPTESFSLWRSLVKGVAALVLGFIALIALLFTTCGILVGSTGWPGGNGGGIAFVGLAVFGLVVLALQRLFR